MKIERCNVVAEQLKDWDFLNNFPQQVLDFQLKKVFSQDGAEYTFVRYENADSCALDVVYTEETGDFVVVKNVGLFRFRDDRFYSRDAKSFATMVAPELEKIIRQISRSCNAGYPSTAADLGFAKWDIVQKLPQEINGYKLFITPAAPLQFLNGSYVLIAYENADKGNQLAIFYNEYRNEVFGELKKERVFQFTRNFDVAFDEERHGAKKDLFLQEAEEKILQNLEPTIIELG